MNRRHPFEWIAEASRTRAFFVIAFLAIVLLISLLALDVPLRTDAAPMGIISYEFAGDVATIEEILASWGPAGRVYAGISLGLDYLFLFTYAMAIGLGCVLLAHRLGGNWAAVGVLIAWGMVAAGVFDIVENYGLIRFLIGEGKSWWPTIVFWSAALKYILVLAGLGYIVVAFITKLVRSRS